MESAESLPLVVRSWLEEQSRRLGQALIVARIETEPDCRIFYYTTEAAARGSLESRHLLAGNAPLIFDQHGRLWMTGTAHQIETYLTDFRGDRRIVRRLT